MSAYSSVCEDTLHVAVSHLNLAREESAEALSARLFGAQSVLPLSEFLRKLVRYYNEHIQRPCLLPEQSQSQSQSSQSQPPLSSQSQPHLPCLLTSLLFATQAVQPAKPATYTAPGGGAAADLPASTPSNSSHTSAYASVVAEESEFATEGAGDEGAGMGVPGSRAIFASSPTISVHDFLLFVRRFNDGQVDAASQSALLFSTALADCRRTLFDESGSLYAWFHPAGIQVEEVFRTNAATAAAATSTRSEVGSFLLRFSASRPERFALDFVERQQLKKMMLERCRGGGWKKQGGQTVHASLALLVLSHASKFGHWVTSHWSTHFQQQQQQQQPATTLHHAHHSSPAHSAYASVSGDEGDAASGSSGSSVHAYASSSNPSSSSSSSLAPIASYSSYAAVSPHDGYSSVSSTAPHHHYASVSASEPLSTFASPSQSAYASTYDPSSSSSSSSSAAAALHPSYSSSTVPPTSPLSPTSALLGHVLSSASPAPSLVRTLFFAVTFGDRLALAQPSMQQMANAAVDAYGLNLVHVACAWNQVHILQDIKPYITDSLLRAGTTRMIDESCADVLCHFTSSSQYMPYLPVLPKEGFKEHTTPRMLAAYYQSKECLALLESWGVTAQLLF